jgi:hypothetical protein
MITKVVSESLFGFRVFVDIILGLVDSICLWFFVASNTGSSSFPFFALLLSIGHVVGFAFFDCLRRLPII